MNDLPELPHLDPSGDEAPSKDGGCAGGAPIAPLLGLAALLLRRRR